jgi:hypothetical protein
MPSLIDLIRAGELPHDVPLHIEVFHSSSSERYVRILTDLEQETTLLSYHVIAIFPKESHWILHLKKG